MSKKNNEDFVTADTLTEAQIRAARDAYPEHISSEVSANALGLPERHTTGGLPLYPPHGEITHARLRIATFLNSLEDGEVSKVLGV